MFTVLSKEKLSLWYLLLIISTVAPFTGTAPPPWKPVILLYWDTNGESVPSYNDTNWECKGETKVPEVQSYSLCMVSKPSLLSETQTCMMFNVGASGLLSWTSSSIFELVDAVTLVTLNVAVWGLTDVLGIVTDPRATAVNDVS